MKTLMGNAAVAWILAQITCLVSRYMSPEVWSSVPAWAPAGPTLLVLAFVLLMFVVGAWTDVIRLFALARTCAMTRAALILGVLVFASTLEGWMLASGFFLLVSVTSNAEQVERKKALKAAGRTE